MARMLHKLTNDQLSSLAANMDLEKMTETVPLIYVATWLKLIAFAVFLISPEEMKFHR